MKFLKLSLVASVAIIGFTNIGFAQPLEEAIKGIDISGMLRYRYTDDRFKDQGFIKDNGDKGSVNHAYRMDMLFKTPIVNAISFNLGIGYDNRSQNVSHGNGLYNDNGLIEGTQGLGSGLGSGSDGKFGVREFNALITPEATATSIKVGKMVMDTPLNDTLDDRATGVLLTNSDLPHWTFALGAYDSFSLDDVYQGWLGSDGSYTKPFYHLGAISNYETNYGNFSGQIWAFNLKDAMKFGTFAEISWDNSLLNLKAQYAYTKLDNSKESFLSQIHEGNLLTKDNDLYVLEAGMDFSKFDIPLGVTVGYWGNTKEGYVVSLDNEGAFSKVGQIWFENAATGIGIGISNYGIHRNPTLNDKNRLSVIYGNLNYDILENLNIGIDYAGGKNKLTRSGVSGDIDFYEISPNITYWHTKSLQIFTYYSFLTTKADKNVVFASDFIGVDNSGLPIAFDNSKHTLKEKYNEFRVEVKYFF